MHFYNCSTRRVTDSIVEAVRSSSATQFVYCKTADQSYWEWLQKQPTNKGWRQAIFDSFSK